MVRRNRREPNRFSFESDGSISGSGSGNVNVNNSNSRKNGSTDNDSNEKIHGSKLNTSSRQIQTSPRRKSWKDLNSDGETKGQDKDSSENNDDIQMQSSRLDNSNNDEDIDIKSAASSSSSDSSGSSDSESDSEDEDVFDSDEWCELQNGAANGIRKNKNQVEAKGNEQKQLKQGGKRTRPNKVEDPKKRLKNGTSSLSETKSSQSTSKSTTTTNSSKASSSKKSTTNATALSSSSSSSSTKKSSLSKKKGKDQGTFRNNMIDTRTSISPSILSCIGNTPLVQLNHVPKVYPKIKCQVLAKCEFFNAGGSVKDRIGLQMILDAEKEGRIKPGDTLIEPTSGNTGIGLALASAVKGYKCIIVLPEKMSKEKVDVLKALGAEIVRTPTEAAHDAPDSHISVAKRLQTEIQNSHILDQYSNVGNPNAHYFGTAEEIWQQCDGKVDMVVAGAGTGGTITGIARRLKELNPNIIIVGVDPAGSILAQPEALNNEKRLEPYAVEGIGYDFIPNVLDRSLIDKWYKSNDTDSLVMMRRLIRDEGLLCGGSCGSAMSIALKAVQEYNLTKAQRCVVILPDSVRNYMTKALSDDWMRDHLFIDGNVIKPKKIQTWWANKFVRDIPLATPFTITSNVTCKAAIALLKREGFDMVPVTENGSVIGVVTEGNISTQILSGRVVSDNISVEEAKVIYKTFRKIGLNDRLAELAHALDHEPFVLVVTEQRCFNVDKIQTKMVVSGIVTRIDLLDYISKGGDER